MCSRTTTTSTNFCVTTTTGNDEAFLGERERETAHTGECWQKVVQVVVVVPYLFLLLSVSLLLCFVVLSVAGHMHACTLLL